MKPQAINITADFKSNPKQGLAMKYLLDEIVTDLVFGGGAGGSKSFTMCAWLIISCLRYPGTRWLMGRSKLKSLQETTLVTFFDVCQQWHIEPETHFRYNSKSNVISFNKEYGGSIILLKDLFSYPSDPDFDSLGSLEITGAGVDEASQISAKAREIIRSRIRYKLDNFCPKCAQPRTVPLDENGRWKCSCGNYTKGLVPKMLMTCNPTKGWLYQDFYKPWKDGTLPPNKKFIQVLAKDNKYTQSSYLENLEGLTGTNRERLLEGSWEYDTDDWNLIEYDAIQNCFYTQVPGGERIITADIARQGRDKTVIGVWNGLRLEYIYTKDKNSIPEAVEMIKDAMKRHQVHIHNVYLDQDGVGCITPETKVFTPNGWIMGSELKPGDEIFSKQNDFLCTEKIISIENRKANILQSRDGYEFSEGHLLPSRTRLNHPSFVRNWEDTLKLKWIILDNKSKWEGTPFRFIRENTLKKQPHGGFQIIKNGVDLSDIDFARFMGWYVSEGNLDEKYICITQSVKSDDVQEIRDVIKACGFSSYEKISKAGEIMFQFGNKNIREFIESECYPGKRDAIHIRVPKLIKNGTKEVIDAFLDAYRKGDGYIHCGNRCYITSSRGLAEDLLEMIFKIGKYATIRIKHKAGSKSTIHGREITRTTDCFLIAEYKDHAIGIRGGAMSERFGDVINLHISGESKLFMVMMPDERSFWVHNGGVLDYLDGANGIVNNSPPVYVESEKENFGNLKSQLGYWLSEYMNQGKIYIRPDEHRDTIAQELEWLRRKNADNDMKYYTLPKSEIRENLGRSPDFLDMITFRMLPIISDGCLYL
jgi:hypothetical protein